MRGLSLATAALAGVTQMASAQDYSAEAVASAILTGFLDQDAATIAPHSNAANTGFFAAILAGEEDASELFGGWRGAAGASWDGMILPARFEATRAYVPFAIETPSGNAALTSGVPGRYIVVTLELDGPQDSTWGLEDINTIARQDYLARAETRP